MTPQDIQNLAATAHAGQTFRLDTTHFGDPDFAVQCAAFFGTARIPIALDRDAVAFGPMLRLQGRCNILGLAAECRILLNFLTPAVWMGIEASAGPSSLRAFLQAASGLDLPPVLDITTEPISATLEITGRDSFLTLTTRGAAFSSIEAEVRRAADGVATVALLRARDEALRLSSLLPPLAPLDALVPRDLMLVLTNGPQALSRVRNLHLPPLPRLDAGIAAIGELPLAGFGLDLVGQLAGIDRLPLVLALAPVPDVEIESPELPELPLVPGLMTLQHGVVALAPEPPRAAIRGDVHIQVLSLPRITGELRVAPGMIEAELATAEPWRNPFGAPNLSVEKLAVSGTILPAAAITIAGEIALSRRDAAKRMLVAVRFEGGVPVLLAGRFNEAITIFDILEALFGVTTPIAGVFDIVQLRDVALSIVPPPLPVIIAGETFDVGFFLKGTLVVAGFTARCSLRIDPANGLDAQAELDRIDLLGVITLSGPSAGGGPLLRLRDRGTPNLELAADVSVLGLRQSLRAAVDTSRITFALHERLGIVDADVVCAIGDGAAHVEGSVRLQISADIGPIRVPGTDISLGSIRLADTGFEGHLVVDVGNGSARLAVGGSFSLLGQTFTLPEISVAAPASLTALPQILIDAIAANAAQIFAAILANADQWLALVAQQIIVAVENVANVLINVFQKPVDAVITSLQQLGRTVDQIARELIQVGVRPEAVLQGLVLIGEAPVDLVRNTIEEILGTQLPHVDIGHFDVGHIDAGHIDLGHVDLGHFDTGHIDLGGQPHVDLGHVDVGHVDFGHVDVGHVDIHF
jgi:hypothetical protein